MCAYYNKLTAREALIVPFLDLLGSRENFIGRLEMTVSLLMGQLLQISRC